MPPVRIDRRRHRQLPRLQRHWRRDGVHLVHRFALVTQVGHHLVPGQLLSRCQFLLQAPHPKIGGGVPPTEPDGSEVEREGGLLLAVESAKVDLGAGVPYVGFVAGGADVVGDAPELGGDLVTAATGGVRLSVDREWLIGSIVYMDGYAWRKRENECQGKVGVDWPPCTTDLLACSA
jgi:hypothetical protein